jgi:hypothetical protein
MADKAVGLAYETGMSMEIDSAEVPGEKRKNTTSGGCKWCGGVTTRLDEPEPASISGGKKSE